MSVLYSAQAEGLGSFKDGFWISEKMELVKSVDCKYWIPPSQIVLIEKGDV